VEQLWSSPFEMYVRCTLHGLNIISGIYLLTASNLLGPLMSCVSVILVTELAMHWIIS